MPFPHECLRPVLDPSKPSAGLLCSLLPHPSNFVPNSVICSSRHAIQSFASPPEQPLISISSPNVSLRGKRSFPRCATNPVNSTLRFRTINSVLLESVLASALAYEKVWSSRFRFRQPRYPRSMEWLSCRSLSWSGVFGLHVTHLQSRVSMNSASSIRTFSHKRTPGRSQISILYRWKHAQAL